MKNTQKDSVPKNKTPADKQTLVIFFRGWTSESDPLVSWSGRQSGELSQSFRECLEGAYPNCEILNLNLDLGLLSCEDPDDLVEQAIRQIDHKWNVDEFGDIVIVGYSMGGPIARKTYVVAAGVDPFGVVDLAAQKSWVQNVTKIVYVSGILRGWSISTATPATLRFFAPILNGLVWLGTIFKGKTLLSKLSRGAPFIVSGRLLQIALETHLQTTQKAFPDVISILGTQDEFISPADCIELTRHSQSAFVEVPNSKHADLLHLDNPDVGESKRRNFLERILSSSPGDLRKQSIAINEDDINDYFDDLDRPNAHNSADGHDDVKHVVIILHGIRDNGFWTKRIAKSVKALGERPIHRAPSPSYGFFSILDFLQPRVRTRQSHWLLEQYAEVRDCYRSADISFVGHSNGTYLAKKALELCKAVKFKNIVLAGSVIRTDHDWSNHQNQIEGEILNLKGAKDAIVAWLPGTMERLKLNFLDVGGAGYHGFLQSTPSKGDPKTPLVPSVHEFILPGGHSAGVTEQAWDCISQFIVNGSLPNSFPETPRLPKTLDRIMPIFQIGLLAAICIGLYLVLSPLAIAVSLLILLLIGWLLSRLLKFY